MKKRLDLYLLQKYPQYSRRQIQDWIFTGNVTVNNVIKKKPGEKILINSLVILDIKEPKYVSRAGLKLEKALDYFKLDVKNFIVLDAGLSTGGFTDCLLQYGVKKVFGVDVGHSQVHKKIKKNSSVIVMEKRNLKTVTIEDLGEQVDLITLDLSFISILKVLKTVSNLLKRGGHLITLIKPQFEVQKHDIRSGGLIIDPKVHQEVLNRVKIGIENFGFDCIGIIDSPVLGGSGNKEFLGYFYKK